MTQNVGSRDRLFRTIFGVLGMLLGFLFIQGVVGAIIGALGLISLATGIIGWCGVYALLGRSTVVADDMETQITDQQEDKA
jgi:uncharacterized membrane protein YuzA (DUF378 family)